MAGMIQEQTKQQINGLARPDAAAGPGTLFKSRDYVNQQTELMIMVTPYIVRAVAQKDLSRPTTASPIRAIRPASCSAGSTASTARRQDAPTRRNYHGKYGFILD